MQIRWLDLKSILTMFTPSFRDQKSWREEDARRVSHLNLENRRKQTYYSYYTIHSPFNHSGNKDLSIYRRIRHEDRSIFLWKRSSIDIFFSTNIAHAKHISQIYTFPLFHPKQKKEKKTKSHPIELALIKWTTSRIISRDEKNLPFNFHISPKKENPLPSPPPLPSFFSIAHAIAARIHLRWRRGEERRGTLIAAYPHRTTRESETTRFNGGKNWPREPSAWIGRANWGRGRGRPAPGNLPAAQRFRPSEKRPEPRPNTRGGDRFHVNYIGECAVEFVVLAERRGEGEGSFKATVNLSAVSYARHFSLTVGGLGRGWPIPGTLFMEIKKGGWPKFSLRYRFQLFKTCNLTGQCTIEWYFYPKLDRAVWKYCF